MDQEVFKRIKKYVGTQRDLAKHLGVQPQAISKWKRTQIPATRVVEIERLTGGNVTRQEIRPDVFYG